MTIIIVVIKLVRKNIKLTMKTFDDLSANNADVLAAYSATATKVADVIVTCQSCGATTKIAGNTVGECEYCGSPINPED